MSGGGGGQIIIRSQLRALANTETVTSKFDGDELNRLFSILGKPVADWTRRDDRFVIHCIGGALEDCAD